MLIAQKPGKPDVVLLDEAGIVGRMAFSSATIGLCTKRPIWECACGSCSRCMLPASIEYMQEALPDGFGSPNAISRHADPEQGRFDQLQTIASIVADCDNRECWIAFGPPDDGGYEHYTLDALARETARQANVVA